MTERGPEYFEKRIRAILETVLPGMRDLYQGVQLAEKEKELFSRIMEKFLPYQTHYTENYIRNAFSEAGYAPPADVGDALKIMTEAVANGGIQVFEVRKTRKIENMVMPTAYRVKTGAAG